MGLVGGVLGFCLGLPIGLAAAYFVYLRYFAAARRLQVRTYGWRERLLCVRSSKVQMRSMTSARIESLGFSRLGR
jgi:hypothetical protein